MAVQASSVRAVVDPNESLCKSRCFTCQCQKMLSEPMLLEYLMAKAS
jgi:hypothetical protein